MGKDTTTEDFELYKSFNFSSFSFNLDTPIYKYIPLKYVKIMIENKKLLALPVSSWEDVYENWLEKHLKRGLPVEKWKSLPTALGQCWTTEEESDAMWRIYSKIEKQIDGIDNCYDNMAIRIKTTPRKLLEQLLKNKKENETIFIGPVDYLERDKFEERRRTILKAYKSNPEKALANSFFIKRNPFEHEKEVRIIVIPKTKCKSVEYDITPDFLIDEFVIDPRIQRKDYYIICKKFIEIGVSVNKVRQSELYQWNPFPIIKNQKTPKTKEELKEIIIMRMIQDGINCNLNDLSLHRVTDLSDLFAKDKSDGILYKFNGDISKWDVSNVKNMSGMFAGSQFNGDISKWDVGKVEDMSSMFADSQFNGDISKWDVRKVEDMSGMFEGSRFNRDISKWDVGKVEDMSWMFYDSSFDGDIHGWNVNNVNNIRGLFNDYADFSSFEEQIALTEWKKKHYCPRGNKGKDVDEEELDEIFDEELDDIEGSFSLADAYDNGYHYGYWKGCEDAKEGNDFDWEYDDPPIYCDYDVDYQKYKEIYQNGYWQGYEDGYYQYKL